MMNADTRGAMLLRLFDGVEGAASPDGGEASAAGGGVEAGEAFGADMEGAGRLPEEYRTVLEAVARRYGIGGEDWKALEGALADDAVQRREALKARCAAAAAERRLRAWAEEAGALKGKAPGFDLAAESRDGRFRAMLRAGVPMELAYRALHTDELLRAAMYAAAADAERRVVDNVRARGGRPIEAGTAGQGGFTVREDVSRLSRQERADIARRAAKGEVIRF